MQKSSIHLEINSLLNNPWVKKENTTEILNILIEWKQKHITICRMQLKQCLERNWLLYAYIKKKKGLNQWPKITLLGNLEKEEQIEFIVSRTKIKLWAEINKMEKRQVTEKSSETSSQFNYKVQ